MKKYLIITIFGLLFCGNAHGATFFIDSQCNTPGNGTTATCSGGANDSYDNIDDFADVARNAGDTAIVRRVASGSQNGTDVTFSSTGNLNSPITIEADYSNSWGDFSSSSQTYTVARGSKQMDASGSITGIAAGDWIYVYNDKTNVRDFAYEVATVSGTKLTLYFPYKGNNPGTGLTLTRMPAAPIWGTIAGDFNWSMSDDNYWVLAGIDIRSTDAVCALDTGTTNPSQIVARDMILEGNDISTCAIHAINFLNYYSKIRNNDSVNFLSQGGTAMPVGGTFKDILVDCDADDTIFFANTTTNFVLWMTDVVASGSCGATALNTTGIGNSFDFNFRNYSGPSSLPINSRVVGISGLFKIEDFQNILGSNSIGFHNNDQGGNIASASQPYKKTLSTLRVGGGSSSIKILPPGGTVSTGISSNFYPQSFIKVFEYPIYLNTSQTTFNTYFKPDNIASWSADPTATQLWVEIDVLASASGAFRYTKKSTGVVDFNGTAGWQSIPLTVIASQSGNAYLRAYYGKPKEVLGTTTGDANLFYVDTKIDITQP